MNRHVILAVLVIANVATALLVASQVEEVLALDPAFMRTADKEAALVAWTRVATLVEAERLRLLAVSGDVADAHGARDAAAWLAHDARRRGRARLHAARRRRCHAVPRGHRPPRHGCAVDPLILTARA